MARFEKNGIQTNYEVLGGLSSSPLVLSNSLGTDHTMWDLQVPKLNQFRLIRYDTLGHGLSDVPEGPYTIEQLGNQVIDLLDHLEIDRVNFCGLSMGGVIGQWLAINHSNRIDKLILANTAPKIGASVAWLDRAKLVRSVGMDPVADSASARWFTHQFFESQKGQCSYLVERLRATNAEGYAACCEALAGADFLQNIHKIQAETLIIAGTEDPVTTISDALFMVKMIPNSSLVQINASHISNVEKPEQFSDALTHFLG
ncbi:3-oxoadipate enol-lactonase [Polynucleobacter sp. MWH-Loch1C5]|uniref:3-oxoadipate enol-lactonase n=1 Tax=Polynucleobacter sp. MWH-Loch1C5 TaxID=2689108 RepID=UPI001C0B9D00|nr:3-oxoadipate enol-lactonase [Polynucleobacter sp. MWH-Loch1C5]MBU3541935.1 3-oxoadipate enol-lactonase [Polynucleobacter sp. MWH-Loch1C5]